MDWFGKSSKAQPKNDIESLGIRFEPIVFYPERNAYELRVELPGCPQEAIKLTYDKRSGTLKLQGQKQKTEFVHKFSIPPDCLSTDIFGRFRGDVLHIIMPRSLSEWPASEDPTSNKEDDQKAYSDRKATEQADEGVGQNSDKLPAKEPAPPPSDQKSTDEVRERGEKDLDELPDRVPAPQPSDQKLTNEVRGRRGKAGNESPARGPVPPPSDQKMTEKSRPRDEELYHEISAPRPSALEPSRSVKELREKFQKNLSKIAAPLPPPPSPPSAPPLRAPSRAEAAAPWNRKRNEIGARKQEEEDPEPPSDQKKAEQGEVESNISVVKSPKKERESTQEVAESAKIVTKSKAKEESEEKKPSAGGKEKLGLMGKVKETGKAAVAVAMKEENRLVVIIGAAVLTILVIGASLRSASKKPKN